MKGINIEIKARYENHSRAKELLMAAGATFSVQTMQIDTYYEIPYGRLKLRQSIDEKRNQLIFYDREDIAGPKKCSMKLFAVDNADALKGVLDLALKRMVIVEKIREVWMMDNVRIHLDEVKGLGRFIEFEIMANSEENLPKSRIRAEEMIKLLGVNHSSLIEKSYSDMLMAQASLK